MAHLGVILKQPGETLAHAVDYSLVFGNAAGVLVSAVVTAASGISVAQSIASTSLNLIFTGGTTATDYAVTIVAQVNIDGVAQTVEDEFTVRVLEVIPSLLAPIAIKPWMAWASDLTPKVPDALLPSIMEALQEATRRHFTKTRAYRINGIALGSTVAGQSVYVVPLPSGVQLVGVPDARVGENDATEIQRYAAVEIPRDTDPTPDTHIAVNGTNSVLIWPTPTVAGQAITINAAVAPDETLEGIEHLLYVEHQEAIEAAALAELYGDKTKPWSDPAMARALNREGKTRRLMHSTQAGPRSERMRLRSNPT
jgi:hypothetical protein